MVRDGRTSKAKVWEARAINCGNGETKQVEPESNTSPLVRQASRE